MRRVPSPLLACIVLGALLTGCGTGAATFRPDLSWQRMGVRPDEPKIGTGTSCDEYKEYVGYAQGLMEAYHARATQNRMWIYIAGITGLGVVAATGGLAAAAAVGVGTLALLSISGGFTAGTFAIIDNADLAKSYTIAAKRVDTALSEADGMLPSGSRYGNEEACGDALLKLKESVTEARTILEASRTDVAVGAIDRAREAQKTMTALLAAQPGPATQVTRSAEISAIDGKTGTVSVKPDDEVTLTVSNGQLDQVAPSTIIARVGSRDAPLVDPFPAKKGDFEYTVKIRVPSQPSGTSGATYRPALLVGPNKQRIPARTDLLLKYP
jgi:hypothetical protein